MLEGGDRVWLTKQNDSSVELNEVGPNIGGDVPIKGVEGHHICCPVVLIMLES